MQKIIRILNGDYDLLGEVDEVESLIFTRKNGGFGDFTLTINGALPGAKLFELGHIVYMDEARAGFIEVVETQMKSQGEACDLLTVTGRTLEHLLSYRIITQPNPAMPQNSHNSETLIKTLVAQNMGAEALPQRQIPNLEIVESRGGGGELIWEWDYKNLAEEVTKLCAQSGLGIRMKLDLPRKTFVFDVAEGANRSVAQSLTPPVILSPDYDNVFEQTCTESRLDAKNTALAGGCGDGEFQETLWVNDENTGISRREIFVEDKTFMYGDKQRLTELGGNSLSELSPVQSIDGKVNPYHTLKFDRDFFLGDVVTIKWKKTGLDKQITEVTESWDEDGYGVTCTLGKKPKDLLDKMKEGM